jgi:hypothetical protein
MVSHKNCNLNADEGFVIFLTPNFIKCLTDANPKQFKSGGFKPQALALPLVPRDEARI